MSKKCELCKDLEIKVEESNKMITVLSSNLEMIQKNLIDSTELISIYKDIKSENEILKEQNNKLKDSLRNYNEDNHINVQIDKCKQITKEIDKINKNPEALESANEQLAIFTEDERKFKEDNKRLRHTIKEKDKQISSMKRLIKIKDELMDDYQKRGGLEKIRDLELEIEQLRGHNSVGFINTSKMTIFAFDSLLESKIESVLNQTITENIEEFCNPDLKKKALPFAYIFSYIVWYIIEF